jgi:hypothetical protein
MRTGPSSSFRERGISIVNLPSSLKLHPFRRNEPERPYREQA